jgi:lysophospholipase L1-like esterase
MPAITDGYQSLTGANARWPNYLARRLNAVLGDQAPGVVDEGIQRQPRPQPLHLLRGERRVPLRAGRAVPARGEGGDPARGDQRLHPNDVGYEAMADAVPLAFVR